MRRFFEALLCTNCVALICSLCSISIASAADDHLGIIEYELACMPCHGINGGGDGPLAKKLKLPPSDLTQIASLNNGQFPFQKIVQIIDGREHVAAHGERAMPVWGDRYRIPMEIRESREAIERRARSRIESLARYVESLQKR